ncbi:Uncharacterised protein [Weeksella virosa]|nr:Uncharacterised protein [Weeksella virosa]
MYIHFSLRKIIVYFISVRVTSLCIITFLDTIMLFFKLVDFGF